MPSIERSLPITVTSVSFRQSMDRANQGIDQVLKDPIRVKVETALTEVFNGQRPIEIGTQRALVGLYSTPDHIQDSNAFADTIAASLPQSSWEEQRAASTQAGKQVVALLTTNVIQPDAYSREMTKTVARIPESALEGGGCVSPMLLTVELTPLGTQGMEKIIKERGIVMPENQDDLTGDDITLLP